MKIEVEPSLTLQLFERADTEALYECIEQNRAHLVEWQRWLRKFHSKAFTQAFIDQNQRSYRDFIGADVITTQHPGFQFGVFAEGELVGMIGYQAMHLINRICSLGYWLAEPAQGNGYITKSCRSLITHSFRILNFNRIEIQCSVENRASIAVAERLNFTKEATLADAEYKEEQEEYVDHQLYRMLRRDWNPG